MIVIYGSIIDKLQWAGSSIEKVNWNKHVYMERVFKGKKKKEKSATSVESSRKEKVGGKNGFEMTALSKYSGVLPSIEEIHI